MFDLVDVIKSHSDKPDSENLHTMVLFHQSEECKSFVEEACRFEGLELPKTLVNNDKNIHEHARENSSCTIIIELTRSQNVSEDMRRISHLLPNNTSVIVVGTEGTICTIRNLKTLGFHYLFWPACQEEFVELLHNLRPTQANNVKLSPTRKAKNIAILGAKGGVGTSFFASQLAQNLAEKHNSSCVVADYNFTGGNLDILLNVENFSKRNVSSAEVSTTLDTTYAMSMTQDVNKLLSLLSIESDTLNEPEMRDILRTVINALSSQFNFIVEDFSSTSSCKEQLEYIAKNADIVLLVMDKTVSSLREAKRLLDALKSHNSIARHITILNNTRPEKAATVSDQEVKSFLEESPDITCAYESGLSQAILNAKALNTQRLQVNNTVEQLTSLVLGKPYTKRSAIKLKQWLKKA